MMSTSAPTRDRLSIVDWLRLKYYFIDFNLWMSDYPQREYRRIAKALKAEVRAAAADVGMKKALEGLGTPRGLAAGYLAEIGSQRPRWNTGAIAAAFALVLPFVAWGVFVAGSISTLEAQGGGRAELHFLGAQVEAFVDDPGTGSGITMGAAWWAWVLPLTLLVFLVASRAWRALLRR